MVHREHGLHAPHGAGAAGVAGDVGEEAIGGDGTDDVKVAVVRQALQQWRDDPELLVAQQAALTKSIEAQKAQLATPVTK